MSKILIIDDSPSALAVTEQILSAAGHQVISRLTASGAIKLAAKEPVDLIVTDIYMPDQDGLEVIGEARRACPQIPVIAISGAQGGKDLLDAAKLMGAACILHKPFSGPELLHAIGALLAPRVNAQVSPREARRG